MLNVEFYKLIRKSESENIQAHNDLDVKTIFDAAIILRKAIARSDRWVFTCSLNDAGDKYIPKDLYCFFQ